MIPLLNCFIFSAMDFVQKQPNDLAQEKRLVWSGIRLQKKVTLNCYSANTIVEQKLSHKIFLSFFFQKLSHSAENSVERLFSTIFLLEKVISSNNSVI